jgi:hypothetical protein
MASGTAIIDFGAFPGCTHATVGITGQTNILAGSKVEVWLDNKASADHSADEHFIEPLRVGHSTIVAGTGFTAELHYIGVHPQDNTPGLRNPAQPNNNTPMAYGKFNVAWAGDYT